MSDTSVSEAPPSWLRDIARCPRCLGELVQPWRCAGPCGLGEFRTAANGAPVLIDFDQSVIDPAGMQRPIAPGATQKPGLRSRLRPLLTLTNGRGANTAMRRAGELLRGRAKPRVLIVGGGERWEGLEHFLAAAPDAELLNSDVYPGPFVHVISDAHQLAFADESFDLVIIQAVLEHLIDPAVAVAAIWRVLKPDGVVLADTPFLQAVHMGAYDFTRFTPLGQRALFKRFEQIEVGVSAGPMSVLRWSIEHALRSMFRTRWPGLLLRPLTLPLSWIDQFSPRNRFALDACSGSYFIGRKSTHTATPREIIAAYRGAQ